MVAGITSTNTMTASATTTGTTGTKGTTSATDYETFLRMLTTQIQNQDPLNPMESSDFAVQLATFSGVEQQVRTNDLLSTLVEGASGGQLGELSGWIGRQVRTTSPVCYSGEPLTLAIEPEAGADDATLVTLDAQGREIARERIGSGSGEVDWQGRDGAGQPLASGLYHFRLESLREGEVVATSDVPAWTTVTGAELSSTGPLLLLPGDNSLPVDQVTAIRDPASTS